MTRWRSITKVYLSCLGIGLLAWTHVAAQQNNNPCVANWGAWQCGTLPGLTITVNDPGQQCVDHLVTVTANDPTTSPGTRTRTDSNGCFGPETEPLSFTSTTVSWQASGCNPNPSSGNGSTATFTPSTSGNCTVTFTAVGTTSNPTCSNTATDSVSFSVVTTNWGSWTTNTAPSITVTADGITNCVGVLTSVTATATSHDGERYRTDSNGCAANETNALPVGTLTYGWTASGCCGVNANGNTDTATFTPTSAGSGGTITFTVQGSGGGSNSTSVGFMIIEVGSLAVTAGGDKDLGGKTNVVCLTSNAFVTVTAATDPAMTTNFPNCWGVTGGTKVDELTRKVSKSTAGAYTVTATAGTSTSNLTVMVVEVSTLAVTAGGGTDIGGGTNVVCVTNGTVTVTATSNPGITDEGSLPSCWQLTTNGVAVGGTGQKLSVDIDKSIAGITTVIAKAGDSVKTNVIMVVEVASLTASEGTDIGGGTNVVCWSSNGVVTVTATTNPSITDTNSLPDCWILSTNGVSVGKALSVDISKTNAAITQVIASAGTSAKTNTIIVVKTDLKSLEFTSDHNLMRDGTNVLTAGTRYPDIEWVSGTPGTNAPMTHTAGATSNISVQLTLDVKGLPDNTLYSIVAASSEAAFAFSVTGTISSGTGITISITSTNAIGKEIRKIDASISWTFTVFGTSCDPSSTGPHVIYTTLGTPLLSAPSDASVPNVPRMEIAVPRVAAAITAAGSASDAYTCHSRIVFNVMQAAGAYALTNGSLGDVTAWTFPTVAPKDCIAIARFVRNVCLVEGVPGTIESKTYMAYYRTAADPDRPKKAIEGSLNTPLIKPGDQGAPLTTGLDPSWVLSLADANCTKFGSPSTPPGTEGCGPGGLNAFEAAVVYTDAVKTWYFPAGAGPTRYDSSDAVVQIFQTMVWVHFGDHDADATTPTVLVVKKVDYTYTSQPNVDLCP